MNPEIHSLCQGHQDLFYKTSMPRESTLQAITKTLILISKRDYDETGQLSDASDDSDE